MTTVFTIDRIKAVLDNPLGSTEGVGNKRIIYRMLQAMYSRQTADEQTGEHTKYQNQIGFNKIDVGFLSSVAKNSQKYGQLTDKQAMAVAKSLKKYAKQLAEISAEKRFGEPVVKKDEDAGKPWAGIFEKKAPQTPFQLLHEQLEAKSDALEKAVKTEIEDDDNILDV